MRIMLKVNIPVDAGNAAAEQGRLGETIKTILDDLKPEAAYFTETEGERTAFLFLELSRSSEIPRLAEPWFIAFSARVEIHPVMTLDDLAEAGPHIEQAVKRYG